MSSRLVINGIDGEFAGMQNITRAEFAAMVVRALGFAENGDGRYNPLANITRQEAMVMIQRAAKVAEFTGKSDSISEFTDADGVADWALDAVKFNVASDLIIGSDGYLNPKGNITRSETVTVILRLLQKAELVDVRTDV